MAPPPPPEGLASPAAHEADQLIDSLQPLTEQQKNVIDQYGARYDPEVVGHEIGLSRSRVQDYMNSPEYQQRARQKVQNVAQDATGPSWDFPTDLEEYSPSSAPSPSNSFRDLTDADENVIVTHWTDVSPENLGAILEKPPEHVKAYLTWKPFGLDSNAAGLVAEWHHMGIPTATIANYVDKTPARIQRYLDWLHGHSAGPSGAAPSR